MENLYNHEIGGYDKRTGLFYYRNLRVKTSNLELYVQNIKFIRIKVILMDSKLTLKLDSTVIENAKLYAKSKNTSVSQLIESYLELLTNPNDHLEVTPLVKSLSGVLKVSKTDNYREEYRKHILNKYSK